MAIANVSLSPLTIERIGNFAPIAILVASQSGTLTYCNDLASSIFGIQSNEMLKLRMEQLLASLNSDEIVEVFDQVVSGQIVMADIRTQIMNKLGREIECDVRIFMDRESDQSSSPSIVTVYISAAREPLGEINAIHESKAEAELISRSKNVFLATISHEIRTPLAAILGASELLLMSQEDIASNLQIIRRNGNHLLTLVDQVLDLTKIEARQLTLNKDKFDLTQEISTSIAAIERKARDKNLQIEVHLSEKMPKEICTDATRFRQIILNLLNNAVKFTHQGRISVNVIAETSEKGDVILEVFVSDSGIGIEQGHSKDIFKTFSQFAERRENGAIGLGLALSHRLAIALGGDLRLVETRVGEGTTFCFSLPILEQPEHRRIRSENLNSLSEAVSDTRLDGIEILVVEDSQDLSILTTTLLKRAGAVPDTAYSGIEAVTKAMARHFDVILMDIQLPEMDGFDATVSLRKQGYKRPIIALTAHALLEERLRCLKAGCNDYMSKPITFGKLAQTIQRFC